MLIFFPLGMISSSNFRRNIVVVIVESQLKGAINQSDAFITSVAVHTKRVWY